MRIEELILDHTLDTFDCLLWRALDQAREETALRLLAERDQLVDALCRHLPDQAEAIRRVVGHAEGTPLGELCCIAGPN